ncbi:SusD/RagB family nutrient-binding outer membrane lipoprotein [Pedobacter sp. PWIIR3]
MKKFINIHSNAAIILLGIAMLFSSCAKDFDEVNTDPVGDSTTTPNRLLAPALVNVLSANMNRNRTFNNELMQVTVNLSDADAQVFRYDFRRTWADYTWNAWYPELTNFKDIYVLASNPTRLNKSYQAISLITQCWVSSLLTDTYGDVPYSQANQGKFGVFEPAYDRQKDIYLDMFKKLEEANTLLEAGFPIVSTGDPVYQGDVFKWRRLGNSMYLRLLMRLSGKSEVSVQVISKIKEIVDSNPGKYPIMLDNSHTAKILWNGTNSSSAVYSSPHMINVRPVDFRGPAITEFFIDRLRNWDDPRLRPALGKNSTPRFGIAQGPSGFIGVPSGYAQGSGVPKQAYFYSDAQDAGYTLQTDPYTGIIMNVAEVDFILAEAAAKGFISGSGETYYNKGIVDAINYWLPGYMSKVTDANFTTFVKAADIEWDNSLPLESSLAGVSSKMELIFIQKYYALFLVDFQQWFDYRRTGHPFLPKGVGLANGGQMPARLNYPIISQSANPTSYKNAIAAQGADDINTKVWWQKP